MHGVFVPLHLKHGFQLPNAPIEQFVTKRIIAPLVAAQHLRPKSEGKKV